MSRVKELHEACRTGDIEAARKLLAADGSLANAVSETDMRGTYPLHVTAEFNQPEVAKLLLEYGANVTLLDSENAAIALGWAAFFGRPDVVAVLLDAGSEPSQRNKHGLTALGCAVGGTQGRWKQFSNATVDDWQRSADIVRANGGVE